MHKSNFVFAVILVFSLFTLSFGPKNQPQQSPGTNTSPTPPDAMKKDTTTTQTQTQNTQNTTPQNQLPIDTAPATPLQQTVVPVDTAKFDSTLITPASEDTLTNTKLFIYILLSALGLALFFYIFVMNLFKTFHKRKSTRQSLLLSWSLYFIVSIIWIFIIWGLVAGFWTYASFMIIVIFLFIISLIMTIIAVKSK